MLGPDHEQTLDSTDWLILSLAEQDRFAHLDQDRYKEAETMIRRTLHV